MPRTVFLLGVALLLVALAFLATDALLWRPGVTEANVRRVRAGMTLQEVQAILGEGGKIPFGYGAPALRMWEGGAGVAVVSFTTAGRVMDAAFLPAATASPLDPLRKALGR